MEGFTEVSSAVCNSTNQRGVLSEAHEGKNQRRRIKWVSFSVLLLPSARARFGSDFSSRKSYAVPAVRYSKAYTPLVNQFRSASSCLWLPHSVEVLQSLLLTRWPCCTSKTSRTSDGHTAVLCFLPS